MKKTIRYGNLIAFIYMILSFSSVANANSLPKLLTDLSNTIPEIESEKTTLSQVFDYNRKSPHNAAFLLINSNNKNDKVDETEYEFNLADLDPDKIRYETGRKAMTVVASTYDGQKQIRTSKNGEVIGYKNKIEILATDIDNARAIIKLLKQVQPIAENNWNRSVGVNFDNFSQVRRKIQGLVIEATDGERYIEQKFSLVDGREDELVMSQSITDKKGNEVTREYRWSMADVLPYSMSQDAGKVLKLPVGLENNLIRVAQDFEQKNYQKNIKIFSEKADDGRLIRKLLLAMVEPSKKAIYQRMSRKLQGMSLEKLLSSQITTFRSDEDLYDQSLTASCTALYKSKFVNKKEKQNIRGALFNYGLLSDLKAQIVVRGTDLGVKLNMRDQNNYIRIDNAQGPVRFDKDVILDVESLENARVITHFIPDIVRKCSISSKPQPFSWVQSSLANINKSYPEVSQSIDLLNGNSCKLKYDVSSSKKNKTMSSSYEFNLSDIDPDLISINIAGIDLSLELHAKNKEKVINFYDGKKKAFSNKLNIRTSSINNSVKLKSTFAHLIKSCSE